MKTKEGDVEKIEEFNREICRLKTANQSLEQQCVSLEKRLVKERFRCSANRGLGNLGRWVPKTIVSILKTGEKEKHRVKSTAVRVQRKTQEIT